MVEELSDAEKQEALLRMVKPPSPVEPTPPVPLAEAVRRAVEMVERPRPPVSDRVKVTSLGRENLGLGPHPWDHPNYADWLGKKLSRELDEAMPSLLGIPVETDPSMPPGTWKMRMNDGTECTGTWPRITVPGVETLAEALKRQPSQDPPPPPLYTEGQITEFLKHRDLEQFILSMTWFRSGLDLIHQLRMAMPSLPPLVWLLPPDVLPPGSPEMTQLYNLPVRYVDGIRPHLGFELKEITK